MGEDTEEVALAKAEFAAAFEAAAAAIEAGTLPEVIIPEGAPESVVDTEEVAAAKAVFAAVHAAASAPATTYAVGGYGYAAFPHHLAFPHHAALAPVAYSHGALSPFAYSHAYAHSALSPPTYAQAPVLLG